MNYKNTVREIISEIIHDQMTPTMTYYAFDWDDNLMYMPTKIYLKDDKVIVYNYLTKYVEAYLNIDSYGPCFSNEKVNEKYFFNEVNMCGIVEFLLNNEQVIYLPPKDQLKFGLNLLVQPTGMLLLILFQ